MSAYEVKLLEIKKITKHQISDGMKSDTGVEVGEKKVNGPCDYYYYLEALRWQQKRRKRLVACYIPSQNGQR